MYHSELSFLLYLLSFISWFFLIASADSALHDSGVNQRIVGGSTATDREFPYQGLLRIRNSITTTTVCGCVLIHPRWALSAARCTYGESVSNLEVTFGTNKRDSQSSFAETRAVIGLYNHPSYGDSSNEFDISMLQFKTIAFDSYKSSIMLPISSVESLSIDNSSCTITGWGSNSEQSTSPSTNLKKATVPLIDNSLCLRWYLSTRVNISIVDSMICAGFRQGGVDACHGDIGGPLACQFFNGTSVLIGITSFGRGCGRARNPWVYTRVHSYYDWIQTTIANNGMSAKITEQYFTYIFLISLLTIIQYQCSY